MSSGLPDQQTPSGDGEVPIHGMYSEDLRNIPGGRQICGLCASRSRGSFQNYARLVLTYHQVDLLAAGKAQEGEFLVWFSNQAVPQTNEPSSFIEKIRRWNQVRKEHANE